MSPLIGKVIVVLWAKPFPRCEFDTDKKVALMHYAAVPLRETCQCVSPHLIPYPCVVALFLWCLTCLIRDFTSPCTIPYRLLVCVCLENSLHALLCYRCFQIQTWPRTLSYTATTLSSLAHNNKGIAASNKLFIGFILVVWKDKRIDSCTILNIYTNKNTRFVVTCSEQHNSPNPRGGCPHHAVTLPPRIAANLSDCIILGRARVCVYRPPEWRSAPRLLLHNHIGLNSSSQETSKARSWGLN